MEKTVFYNKKAMGKALIYIEKGQLICDFICRFEENKIYKLFICTENNTKSLGIMLKEKGYFSIKRPINSLIFGSNGEKITQLYIEKRQIGSRNTPPLDFSVFDFSPLENILPTLDLTLQECMASGELGFYAFEGENYLSCSLDFHKPFVLAPFFCIVTPVNAENQSFAVIKLDENNFPVFMNKTCELG